MYCSRLLRTAAILTGSLFMCSAAGMAETVGSGKLASETRAVSGFHGVELACSGNLEIMPGADKEELVVESDDNILPLIETAVRGDGVLVISFRRGESVHLTRSPSFHLTARSLDALTLAGSGNIHVAGRLAADKETIHLPGSGNMEVDRIETTTLNISLAGSGEIQILSGNAAAQSVKLDGSGEYKAEALKSDTATISIRGSGACKVHPEKSLDATISGSGEILFAGQPEVRQHISGSGTVRPLPQ